MAHDWLIPLSVTHDGEHNATYVIYCDHRNLWRILQSMAAHDMCAEIAALLNPFPSPGADDPEGSSSEVPTEHILQEREELAESLRNSWSYGDLDPLLSTLSGLRRERLRLEAEMRMLIAYGRRFSRPRPYKLIDLANAAGMSISGVRTAYEAEEIKQVGGILGRAPVGEQTANSDRTGE